MKNNSGIPNFSSGQVDLLLNLASQKLGVKPEALKQQLQNGTLPQGLSQDNVSQFMNDPKKLEELLRSKSAQQILGNLMKGNGGN